MSGIQFLVDKGRRKEAVIDLTRHKKLWEDIEDVLVSQSRRHEKRIPFRKVKADLIKSGKLRGYLPPRPHRSAERNYVGSQLRRSTYLRAYRNAGGKSPSEPMQNSKAA